MTVYAGEVKLFFLGLHRDPVGCFLKILRGLLCYYLQDVAGKILSFVQKGSRGMCVLSANGSVSNVTIRQPGSSGGLLTYEVITKNAIFT